MKRGGLIAVIVLILAGLAATLLRRLHVSLRTQQMFVSCLGHVDHLAIAWALAARDLTNKYELPYRSGVPGYIMFTEWSARQQGALNCHHGAPKARFGGWQAVNLPPPKWKDLLERWTNAKHEHEIPFIWCGRPHRLGKRVMGYVFRSNIGSPSEGWYLHHEVVDEAKLKNTISTLNNFLAELGQTAIEVNVAEGLAWDSFR